MKSLSSACLAFISLLSSMGHATEYHVDSAAGDDSRDGSTMPNAWKTLGKAAKQVAPGDQVIVHPGVYFEFLELKTAGTAEAPITFRAESVAKGSVTLTGAQREIREQKTKWAVLDEKLGLYEVPLSQRPARVLYDQVDLFPYSTVEELKTFTFPDGSPGPLHGFAFNEKDSKLVVRLHAGGKYGSANPNEHKLAVAPAGGVGGASRHGNAPSHYNVKITAKGPAHIILDGFTFETPGVAGVMTQNGGITVRNCWFLGCRAGVSAESDSKDETKRANDVTIERCDFSQAPTFDDLVEVLERARPVSGPAWPTVLPSFFWQHRSGGAAGYELGIALKVGGRWKIQNNFIHDCVDGISPWALTSAQDVEISGNTFERLVGRAVSTGNHAAKINIHHNSIRDTYEPFSWSPSDGAPWPGPVFIHHNIVTHSAPALKAWASIALGRDAAPACFAIAVPDKNWKPDHMKEVPNDVVTAPMPGWVAYNNTVLAPGSRVFRFNGMLSRKLENFYLINNIIVAKGDVIPLDYRASAALGSVKGDGNVGASGSADNAGPTTTTLGEKGLLVKHPDELGFADLGKRDFSLKAGSPALGRGIKVVGVPDLSSDAGAVAKGELGKFQPTGPDVKREAAPSAKPAPEARPAAGVKPAATPEAKPAPAPKKP